MPVRLIGALENVRGPVADAAASLWGLPPGSARWWRSSACHVFASGAGYLRLVPAEVRSASSFAAIAKLMADLAGRGLRVVAPLPSVDGRLTETVETPLGEMHAMLLAAAPGEQIDVDDLTPDLVRSWGAALAHLHDASPGRDLERDLGLFGELSELDDRELAEDLLGRLARVPRDDIGLVHGDFELDNLAWSGGNPTAFDFDDAAVSWRAADVAIAVRDLGDRDAFIAGYRTVRPLDVRHLGLFARAQAASSMVRAQQALVDAGDALPGLQDKLRQHIDRQRVIAS